MIDPAILRHEPERVRESLRMRGESPELVDRLLAADASRRRSIAEFETMRAKQKDLGREVSRASGDEKAQLLVTTKALAAEVKAANAASESAATEFNELMKQLPNLVFPDVPVGGEEDFVVLETVGTPRDFAAEGFEPKDHLELGEKLGAIDTERGVKVSGSRFYFLTGQGAQLELALLNLAMAKIAEWGLIPMIPPSLVKPSAMEGTGFLGQAEKDVYHLPADDLYLVGTAEVAMAAYHSEEILESAALPLRYAGYSPCFRREAGSYGKDTRGIFRVHWFDKVEMFVYCEPEEAEAEHQKLLAFEKEFIELLELPYQVLDVPSGDLGMSAARKYDCYAWIPTMGKYREITSTSNCTEFQSRRLNIRARGADGVHPVATLNGTLCAMPRIIIALLENHQQADGTVRLPAALRPFFGGQEFLLPTESSTR